MYKVNTTPTPTAAAAAASAFALPQMSPIASPTSSMMNYSPPPPLPSPYPTTPMTPSAHTHSATPVSLHPDELERLRRALGAQASILSSSVARLYLSLPHSSDDVNTVPEKVYTYSGLWGAILLVVDRKQPTSMHLQLYDLHTNVCHANVQLYANLVYFESNPLFHSFEVAEGCVAGLQFPQGFEEEAHAFLIKVRENIPKYAICAAAAAAAAVAANMATEKGTPVNQDQALSKKTSSASSFLRRLFSPNSPKQISAPYDVTKQALPSEWETLFKNAAVATKQRKDSQTNVQTNQVANAR